MSNFAFVPATELARLIRQKHLSPVELLEDTAERIQRLNPTLLAFYTLAMDRARDEARAAEAAVIRGDPLGPLHGIPTAIKDLTPTAGIRTTYGSRLYADYVPTQDAILVSRIRQAGAIIVGKTATPEFGHKGTTESELFGITRNPWDLARSPGGSSGGASAALAAGLLALAHGTDGAGSIRLPASVCGVAGLKPTFGRIAYWPQDDLFQNVSHNGPMARTMGDLALLMQAMAGADPRDPASGSFPPFDARQATGGAMPKLRIAYSPDFGYVPIEREVAEIVAGAAGAFREVGCDVEDVALGWEDTSPAIAAIFTANLTRLFVTKGDDILDRVDATLRPSLEQGLSYTSRDLVEANIQRSRLFNQVTAFFEEYDLLLTPTRPNVAMPVGELTPATINGEPVPPGVTNKLASPFNLTGHPALSVPAGWTADGLPVGLQIVGRRGADELVVRAGAAFEALRPWAHRRPTI